MKWKIANNLDRAQLRPLFQPIIDYYLALNRSQSFNAELRDHYLDAHEELVMQFGVTTSVWADNVCAVLSGYASDVGAYHDALSQYMELPGDSEEAEEGDLVDYRFDLEEKSCCPASQLLTEEC